MFVDGYEGGIAAADEVWRTNQKLIETAVQFEEDREVRIPLVADESAARDISIHGEMQWRGS
jgi:hypothetical protein